jgi:hypothetical protein
MRYILLIYQNTETRNSLSQEDFMRAAVTGGPFLEAKDALTGYRIVDVATQEPAEEIAARWPDAQRWGAEIRALMHGGVEEG